MTGSMRVLSIYEGFFSGGARILHTDVLSGLHGRRGQQHSLLSIHSEVRREATYQPMHEDACYRRLTAQGLAVDTLGRGADERTPYTAGEIERLSALAAQTDVILTLKEQPLGLVNRADLHGRPVITCLHRSDPENQGPAFEELRRAAFGGQLAAAVCCAESTRDAYAAAGVPEELLHVIPNGVDLRRFKPSRRGRAVVRASLGIPAEAPVVVFAARYDRMKNVPLFLAAAREFLDLRPDAHVMLCGAGMTPANQGLLADLAALGLAAERGRVHLLGVRGDPEAIYAAADVVALTSAFGEAAPLCLIEGMLCGAVPVATDVGDCASIVAGHGLIAEPEPAALAHAWIEALGQHAHFFQAMTRNRYKFSRTRMIMAYGSLIRKTHRKSVRVLIPAGAAAGKGSVTLTAASLTVPPPVALEPFRVA
ncbi:glycosyltransferase [Actinospica sp. MGRD01-02]|uniref:Glycosyltransferase n=1 Tax=Actinospica acidithermotolerans TaxID=2828514 RepID=A0A941EAQ3_9ACTN|nr:glycosyltransferase [Actinospica acidithermotolerans]MBR7827747.1 glycosyltransferase [Actinospica acidithermotolerans]